jgi:hypothetical protein
MSILSTDQYFPNKRCSPTLQNTARLFRRRLDGSRTFLSRCFVELQRIRQAVLSISMQEQLNADTNVTYLPRCGGWDKISGLTSRSFSLNFPLHSAKLPNFTYFSHKYPVFLGTPKPIVCDILTYKLCRNVYYALFNWGSGTFSTCDSILPGPRPVGCAIAQCKLT